MEKIMANSKEITLGTMRNFGHRIGTDLEKDPIVMGGNLIFNEETGTCEGMEEPHYKVVKLWQDGNLVKGQGVLVEGQDG